MAIVDTWDFDNFANSHVCASAESEHGGSRWGRAETCVCGYLVANGIRHRHLFPGMEASAARSVRLDL